VVHAHPAAATGFAVAGETIPANLLPELIFLVGRVPIVPLGMPGTPELGDRVEPFLAEHDALLLANHGAVTMGTTLDQARIVVAARSVGQPRPLDARAVATLEALRAQARREKDA
jgi:L-fuculose-phosphate aldolase